MKRQQQTIDDVHRCEPTLDYLRHLELLSQRAAIRAQQNLTPVKKVRSSKSTKPLRDHLRLLE